MSVMNIFTVYFDTTDYPEQFVARRFELEKPTVDFMVADNKEAVMDWIFMECGKHNRSAPVRFDRHPEDDPCIVESWM